MLKGVTSGGGGGITPGTTIITGGTNTRVLFDDNGVVGESAGFVYVKATGQATATLLVASTSLTAPLLQAGATGGTIALSTTAGQGPAIAAGTATTDVNAEGWSQTWNAGAQAFTFLKGNVTNTASAGTSKLLDLQVGGVSQLAFQAGTVASTASMLTVSGPASTDAIIASSAVTGRTASFAGYVNGVLQGYLNVTGTAVNINSHQDSLFLGSSDSTSLMVYAGVYNLARSTGMWGFSSSGLNSTIDANLSRGGANHIVFGSTLPGAGNATSRAEINKAVTAIADNVATATFTVTIPNGAHSAGISFMLTGSAGAGGAIGANEFSALIAYDCVVTRTAGANAVATLSAALLTAITASVAGGAVPTISAAISAISGAVGATNTFTLNVTIHAITGSSTNHTCFCYASLMNSNASGVTIS